MQIRNRLSGSSFFDSSLSQSFISLCYCANIVMILLQLTSTRGIEAAPSTKLICAHPRTSGLGMALQSRFAVEHYFAPQFPDITWRFKFLGGPDATPRNFVLSWLLNGTDCDAMLGPGGSSNAVALSPLVSTLWIDWSSTSISLTDKTLFPYFSRVIPTDAIGASVLASTLVAYKWRRINLIGVDATYSASFTTGLSDGMQSRGGFIEVSRTLPTNPTNTSVNNVIDDLLQSSTRVVVFAMTPTDPAFKVIRDLLVSRGLMRTFVFAFAEAFCSLTLAPMFLDFDGGLCVTYSINAAIKDPFMAAFNARDISDDVADFSLNGFNTAATNFYNDNLYASFAIDAAYLAMLTLNASIGKSLTPLQLSRSAWGMSFAGVTGTVRLDRATGDRIAADAVVYNVANSTLVLVGSLANMTNLTHSLTAQTQGILLLGQYHKPDDMPSESFPGIEASGSSVVSSGLIIGIGILAAFTGVAFLLNKVRETDLFKQLVKSGLWTVVLQLLILGASAALRLVSAVRVGEEDGYPDVFVICYEIMSSVSVITHGLEMLVLIMWFKRTVQAKSDLSEDETILWEFRVAQTHFISLGMDDIPLIVMNFSALLQEQPTVPVQLSLCISCVFAGLKFAQLKDRIVRFFNAPPAPVRRFKSLRSVVSFIVVARRFGALDFSGGLNSSSSAADRCFKREQIYNASKERAAYVLQTAKEMSILLSRNNILSDEYFAFIESYLAEKFDPVLSDATSTVNVLSRALTSKAPVISEEPLEVVEL